VSVRETQSGEASREGAAFWLAERRQSEPPGLSARINRADNNVDGVSE